MAWSQATACGPAWGVTNARWGNVKAAARDRGNKIPSTRRIALPPVLSIHRGRRSLEVGQGTSIQPSATIIPRAAEAVRRHAGQVGYNTDSNQDPWCVSWWARAQPHHPPGGRGRGGGRSHTTPRSAIELLALLLPSELPTSSSIFHKSKHCALLGNAQLKSIEPQRSYCSRTF